MWVLGIVVCSNLTMGSHLDELLSNCASSIHAYMPSACSGLMVSSWSNYKRSPARLLLPLCYMPPQCGWDSPRTMITIGWRAWQGDCDGEGTYKRVPLHLCKWPRRQTRAFSGQLYLTQSCSQPLPSKG